MSTTAPISLGLMQARQRDVAEVASRSVAYEAYRTRRAQRTSDYDGVSVRIGRPGDLDVARLAALDESPVPEGRTLVAVRDGRALAAVPVAGGEAVADPFERTAAIVEVLRARAARMTAPKVGILTQIARRRRRHAIAMPEAA
jgi:hypothetical protein